MSPDSLTAEQHGEGAPQPPTLVPGDAWSSMKSQGLTSQGDCGSQPAARQAQRVTLPSGDPIHHGWVRRRGCSWAGCDGTGPDGHWLSPVVGNSDDELAHGEGSLLSTPVSQDFAQ